MASSMATTGGSTSTKSSAPTARPVHPAIYKTFSPSGAEYSTWARLTTDPIPNLVTAHGSSLRIYRVVGTGSSPPSSDASHTTGNETTTSTATATARHNTRLVLVSSYDDLAGSICSLSTIPSNSKSNNDGDNTSSNSSGYCSRQDGLLVGFAGHARLSLLSCLKGDGTLTSSAIVDLTPALVAHSWGSVTPLEQDVMVAVSSSNVSSSSNQNSTTVAAILGGGVAVATFSVVLTGDHSWMQASEPYIVPLSSLSQHLSTPTSSSTISSTTARGKAAGGAASLFSHGFGEILACAFWEGSTEPTLAVLHTLPGGASWPGRYGGVRRPISLTTISISLQAQRSVILGQTPNLPDDSFQLYPCGSSSRNGNSSGMLVVAVNSIHYVTRSNTQRITTSLAVNGWGPATFVSPTNINPNSKTSGNISSSTCRGNPHPLPKLSIQLNGSQWTFLTPRIALVASTTGKLYTFEVHSLSSSPLSSQSSSTTTKVALSLAPLGRHVGAVGEIASLAALPLASSPSFLTSKDDDNNKTTEKHLTLLAGLVFAGSRMGDSTLLAYVVKEGVPLLSPMSLKRKRITKEEDEDKDENDENQDDQGAHDRIVKTKHEPSSIQGGNSAKSEPDAALSSNDKSPSSSIPEDMIDATVVESFSPSSEVAAQTRDAYETKLQQEEEELYGPNVVPPSSDDDTDESADESPEWLVGGPRDNRPVLDQMSMIVELEALDSLTTLGPLGPGCDGPIVSSSSSSIANKSSSLIGVRERIFPCGYGSSGGLAIVSCPGRDVESIVAEADCLNMHNIFALQGNSNNGNNSSSSKRILLGKEGGGMLLLGVASSTDDNADNGITNTELMEIDLDVYCGNPNETMMEDDDEGPSFGNANDVLTKMTLLGASELFDGKYLLLLVQQPQNQKQTAIVILTEEENDNNNRLYVKFVHPFIASEADASLLSASPMLLHQTNDDSSTLSTTALSYACTWSNGHGTVVSISPPPSLEESDDEEWNVVEYIFGATKDEISPDGEEELDEEELYYKSDKIVSMDVFQYSGKLFSKSQDTNNSGISAPNDSASPPDVPTSSSHSPQMNGDTESDETEDDSDFDEEEMELYGSSPRSQTTSTQNEEESSPQVASSHATLGMPPSRLSTLGQEHNSEDGSTAFVAVCRQSGSLEIYPLADLLESVSNSSASTTPPIFIANGCGHGVSLLSTNAIESKNPRFHKVHAAEIRFFECGPSEVSETSTIPPSKSSTSVPLSGLRSLCLAVETSLGDAHLYTAVTMKDDDDLTGKKVGLTRVPLSGLTLTRQSKEQNRHHGKLKRKGILGASTTHISLFRPNRLHPFHSISGQDGLFAALARPLWFVSERGAPTGLWHRARHAAPAGGKARPVTGFCSGSFYKKGSGSDQSIENSFLTLHERVGRVGSQRLTLFSGLSSVFSLHGVLPGGGVSVKKIPLGVTVRKIEFIDDATVSSPEHPLYALLISRELEGNQSQLNDDGISLEEKRRSHEEKEAVKARRQVEADLGGFDVEQEWVEEIERDDCFHIDMNAGGAPPIPKTSYALWIVDASNDWSVIDSYELDEYEHGMAMKVMTLTDVADEKATTVVADTAPSSSLFITVGTAIVDQDGEDVNSKGRILLFQVKTNVVRAGSPEPITELNLAYEKNILLGPVTSLSCLSCEGKNRIVVGAGAEITVEQWGEGKLTQVGFFHANMQVQDVKMFKTFLILSDAYDSLHFLVWRESDKSLTLLAKDYEPTPVYAAGMISRGASMAFACHDDRENLQFFQYAPGDPEARGGNKLVCRADVHLGMQTVSLESHWCRSSLLIHSATPNSTLAALKQQDSLFGRIDDDQRFGVHFGTSDGGFGAVLPLSEQVYWRLTALQSVMSNALESSCALSHRAWRLYRRTPRRGGCRSNDRKKGVIDGELVSKFCDLRMTDQEDLASAIGSTVELIMDNILELNCASMII